MDLKEGGKADKQERRGRRGGKSYTGDKKKIQKMCGNGTMEELKITK